MNRDFYTTKIIGIDTRLAKLKRYNPPFLIAELLSFALFFASLCFYFFKFWNVLWLISSVTFFIAYIFLRRYDARNNGKIEALSNIRRVYAGEIKYLNGDFTGFGNGSQYIDATHPYTVDMDIFGVNSLFNRINRTVTTGGERYLANSLQTLIHTKSGIDRRREAIDELAEMESWRTEFLSKGMGLNTRKVIDAVCEMRKIKGGYLNSKFALFSVYVVLALLYMLFMLSILSLLPWSITLFFCCLTFFVVLMSTASVIKEIHRSFNHLDKELKPYIELIAHVETAEFHTIDNIRLYEGLFGGENDSRRCFRELDAILSSLDRRGNMLGLFFANMFFASDFFIVRRFIRWRKRYASRMPEWIDLMSKLDALLSMATLRYNHPEAGSAELLEDNAVRYEAKGLYHPFISYENAVKNDFVISDGLFSIITGANMAGKSTFLRSVGINYILAMNGMPVFAESLKLSLFNLYTSMRTDDDVSNGISYFNAELIRLKSLIDYCRTSDHTLIILDEILKGTNSLDKLNGSHLFLLSIKELPVTGIVATHDLELSKMEDEYPDVFRNYCFEVELSDDVKYSYRITQGIAKNQNATFLLKNILKETFLLYTTNE